MRLPYLCARLRADLLHARLALCEPARVLAFTVGCLSLVGCDVFDAELEERVDSQQSSSSTMCTTHADCGSDPSNPIACAAGVCTAINSQDCKLGAGDLTGDAILLGTLLGVTGPTAATNVPRQQSAALAVDEINAVGGVPGPSADSRHIALVTCDSAVDVRRAARHLVNDLKVPAIVGPNTSQDTLDISGEISVRGGTLLLSPAAVASSIADLTDDDLTWTMVPLDEQRAPLMKQQINELEQKLRVERERDEIRLSVIYRNDALGMGTRVGLNSLELNAKSLVQNQSAIPATVTLEPYDPKLVDDGALIERQRAFAPDIVVLAGTPEAIERIMVPLEQRWGDAQRPYYILIDSLRGPELLKAIAGNEDLRRRVRGTGIVPTKQSAPIYDAFRLAYQTKYPGQPATVTGMGPTYDGVYALSYAMAATHSEPVSGATIARGLDRLHGGALEVPVQSTKILAAFRELSQGKPVDAIGTYAPFRWDNRGSPAGGSVEVWCIAGGPQPGYASSGLTFDLQTLRSSGEYKQCER